MIDLRSDTVTMPSKEMKQFMFDASLGDDVYGDDPSINALEEKASDLFGKDAALFVPSGTMANLISVLSHCNRGDEILLGNKSHIFVYEAGGTSVFGGVHSHQLHNNDDGTIDLDMLRDMIESNTKLVSIMMANNEIGTIHPIEEISKICRKNNIILHVDAAQAVGKINLDLKRSLKLN